MPWNILLPPASCIAPPQTVSSSPRPPPTRWRMAIASPLAGRYFGMGTPSGIRRPADGNRKRCGYRGSRVDELVFGVAHREHRAGRLAHHLLRRAAQQDVSQSGVAVRPHDDQVDVRLLGEA